MREFIVIAIFCSQLSWAVDLSPKMLRACIDYDNDIVTVKWTQPEDNCGSFEKYMIYGSENLGPFKKLAEIQNLAVGEYPHSLLVQNTSWRYYITTYTHCNGVDSLRSDTIGVDVVYPVNIEIDSISYNLESQKIIAGWKRNPSTDTKHYEIYDYSSGSGDLLGDTKLLSFDISEKRAGRFPVVLATLDSCNLSSLLSQPHEATYLTGTIDSCSRSINLNWSLYVGWNTIDSQSLYVSVNKGAFVKAETVEGDKKRMTYGGFDLGDTLNFFMRAYKNNKSTSSNTIIFETRKLIKPERLTLKLVDVVDNNIEISWLCEKQNDTKEFIVHSGENETSFKKLETTTVNIDKNEYKILDLQNDPNTQAYFYYITSTDKCGMQSTSTDTSKNLHLDTNLTEIHNEYIGWENGVLQYALELFEGSTWNETKNKPDVFVKEDVKEVQSCFRVAATANDNPTNMSVSHSNVVCPKKRLNYYITTGLNPNGVNKRFVVRGEGLDYVLSTFQIYNRWGELIKSGTLNEEWDGSYQNKVVNSGIYLYVVKIYGINGEFEQAKGVVSVIK